MRFGNDLNNRATRASLLIAFLVTTVFAVGCANKRDRQDANRVAADVHQSMFSGDFAEIYRNSATRFKTVGSESEFVTWMDNLQETLGALRNVEPIAYEERVDSRIGRTQVLIFKLEYDHGRARETLIMLRAPDDKMQLWKLGIEPAD